MIYGKTEPRIFTNPLRELTEETSLGFAAIQYAREVLRMKLYPWQEWALIHMLEIVGDLTTSWHFRYRVVVVLVSRQNGKTSISKVIVSFFMNVLQVPNVFGTSLSLDKAEEVWDAVIADQEINPELDSSIDRVCRTNGNKRLILTGNRIYKVGAPTRRAGRGDSNDLVMLDELREHRDWDAWAAAIASTNAKPNGIVICFSNAGDADSVVLRQVRDAAIEEITGKAAADYGGNVDGSTLGLFEWSADDNASIDDIDALAQANPALNYGLLTEKALLSNRQTMPEAKFRAECMCQTVETLLPAPFSDGAWNAGVDETSSIAPESELYYGIDLSHDRRWCSIAVAGMRTDGNYHVEVVARAVGTEWAIDWFRSRQIRGEMRLAFQARGCACAGLAEQICTLPNITRIALEGSALPTGWERFYDAVEAGKPLEAGETARGGVRVYHLPQPVIDAPAKTMQMRNLGNGQNLPDRLKSPDDIAPLFACICAFAAATAIKEEKQKKVYASAYAQDGHGIAFI